MNTSEYATGDRCIVLSHDHGRVARVMATAEGYAMVRYPRCFPFVVPVRELAPVREMEQQ